jgi:integrase
MARPSTRSPPQHGDSAPRRHGTATSRCARSPPSARRRGWLTTDPASVLERRTQPADRTRAIAAASLERLFRHEDVHVREKCLWRLLYETAARAQEVLSADLTDLDLEHKRLRVRRKGGDSDWLHFQSGSARLLPRLIGERDAGPIFLADRRPSPLRARRSGPVPDHQPQPALLRTVRIPVQAQLAEDQQDGLDAAPAAHSALTHLAEAGVNLPLLMAKSATRTSDHYRSTPDRAPKPSPP